MSLRPRRDRIDGEAELPPHLIVLSPQQRLFVEKFVELGHSGQAVIAAGITGKSAYRDPARIGYDLLRVRKIKDAIMIEQMEEGHSLRSMALKVWREALTHHEPKVRLAAAREIADRFGLVKTVKTEHSHQFADMSEDEIEAFIRDRLAATKIIDVTPVEEAQAAKAEVDAVSPEAAKPLAQTLTSADAELKAALNDLEEIIGAAPTTRVNPKETPSDEKIQPPQTAKTTGIKPQVDHHVAPSVTETGEVVSITLGNGMDVSNE
jgi:hypothetical protein